MGDSTILSNALKLSKQWLLITLVKACSLVEFYVFNVVVGLEELEQCDNLFRSIQRHCKHHGPTTIIHKLVRRCNSVHQLDHFVFVTGLAHD